jgi:hypothetical protein
VIKTAYKVCTEDSPDSFKEVTLPDALTWFEEKWIVQWKSADETKGEPDTPREIYDYLMSLDIDAAQNDSELGSSTARNDNSSSLSTVDRTAQPPTPVGSGISEPDFERSVQLVTRRDGVGQFRVDLSQCHRFVIVDPSWEWADCLEIYYFTPDEIWIRRFECYENSGDDEAPEEFYVCKLEATDPLDAARAIYNSCLYNKQLPSILEQYRSIVSDPDFCGHRNSQDSESIALRRTLNGAQLDILDAAIALGAIDEDHRKSQDEIASRAGIAVGVGNTGNSFSELKRRRFIDARTGRGGGTWLLELGLKAAKRPKDKKQ